MARCDPSLHAHSSRPSSVMACASIGSGEVIACKHPDGRRVTVSFHRPGDTFAPKTLRSILELQARWTDADLKRVRLID